MNRDKRDSVRKKENKPRMNTKGKVISGKWKGKSYKLKVERGRWFVPLWRYEKWVNCACEGVQNFS